MFRSPVVSRRLFFVAVTTLLASVARGAAPAPSAVSQTDSAAARYTTGDLYLKGSRVYTHVFKSGLGHEHAVEGMIKAGRLRLGATQDAGEIVFDIRSYRADTDAARKYLGFSGTTDASTQKQVNANMLGPAVLDAERFPTAVFKIQSARLLSQDSNRGLPSYQLLGELTLHGVTRKLSVGAVAEEENGWTRLRGSFSINQTDFGIKPFTKAFGAIGVADKLTIHGDLWVAGTVSVADGANTTR